MEGGGRVYVFVPQAREETGRRQEVEGEVFVPQALEEGGGAGIRLHWLIDMTHVVLTAPVEGTWRSKAGDSIIISSLGTRRGVYAPRLTWPPHKPELLRSNCAWYLAGG